MSRFKLGKGTEFEIVAGGPAVGQGVVVDKDNQPAEPMVILPRCARGIYVTDVTDLAKTQKHKIQRCAL